LECEIRITALMVIGYYALRQLNRTDTSINVSFASLKSVSAKLSVSAK
jgi:hypothetical protein